MCSEEKTEIKLKGQETTPSSKYLDVFTAERVSDWKWIMYVNRTLDMYIQRQYTFRINAESRHFWAQFRKDQTFLLHFTILTFLFGRHRGIWVFRRETEATTRSRLLKKSLRKSRLVHFSRRNSFYKLYNLKWQSVKDTKQERKNRCMRQERSYAWIVGGAYNHPSRRLECSEYVNG